MHDPIPSIEAALRTSDSRIREKFEYAMYLSVRMLELCESYFNHFHRTEIRNKIVKHILIKRDKRTQEIPPKFIERLLREFESSKQRKRISLGTTLKDIKESLSKPQLRRFFRAQVLAESVLDRKRAYVIAPMIYDHQVDKLLWQSWFKYSDSSCMGLLSIKTSATNLTQVFPEVFRLEHLPFFIKSNALKRIAADNFPAVEFLKQESPVSYLTACVAAARRISDKEAISLASAAPNLNSFGYALWCLGALGNTKALYTLIERSENIEETMPREFWEHDPEADA